MNDRIREKILSLLIIGDVLLICAGLVLAYYLRLESGLFDAWFFTEHQVEAIDYLGHFAFGAVLYLFLASSSRLYRGNELLRLRRAPLSLLKIIFYWAVVYLLISLFFKIQPGISRIYVLLAFGMNYVFLVAWRVALHNWVKRPSIADHLRQRILLVGWSAEVGTMLKAVEKDPHHPYQIWGYIATGERGDAYADTGLRCEGDWDEAERILEESNVEIVVVADIDIGRDRIEQLLEWTGRHGLQLKMITSFYSLFSTGLKVQTLSGVPLLGVEDLPVQEWQNRLLKRAVDIVGALVGLILFAPVILVFALLVYRESPGPVFYAQTRCGRRGRLFRLWKIRSMVLDAEEDEVGWSHPSDPRRLQVGVFMREWNIDELPQFWNVLKGDMSLVGPRPERPELIESFKYKIRLYNIRQEIKPGMTGWAQIHGWRGDTDLGERIRHDLFYIEKWSLWLDLYIMMMTFINFDGAD
jgi:exopolysaccharide biosynthesis polyprenyl glycosylphosphotransferase